MLPVALVLYCSGLCYCSVIESQSPAQANDVPGVEQFSLNALKHPSTVKGQKYNKRK